MFDHRSYAHKLSCCEIKAWKMQAWTRFEPMTSAIPVQYSSNWVMLSSQLRAGHFLSS